MNVFYFLGAIGGILVIIEETISMVKAIIRFVDKYKTMERYYHKNHSSKTKTPMGFKTRKEEAEIEAKLSSEEERH